MKALLFSLAFGLLAMALAIAAAGCGGDGNGGQLTLEEYFQRLDAVQEDAVKQFEARNEAAPASPFTDDQYVAAFRDDLSASTAIYSDVLKALDDLEPPAEVRQAHEEMLAAGRRVAAIVEEAEDSAADLKSQSEVDEFAGELFQGAELNEAGQRFTDACSSLQGIADDKQIDVDLNCQPE